MSLPLGGGVIEPPTPSMESTTSASSLQSRDSVFEGRVDVEMDDAGSFTSVEDSDCQGDDDGDYSGVKGGYGLGLGVGVYEGGDGIQRYDCGGDVEMDEGTPTMTARPVDGRGAFGRGWVPWREHGVVSLVE
jgi:hypothetical protein